MELKEYFENVHGTGVLSTADSNGRVDSAIYSRPHVMDDDTIAFVMRERLTHHNLQSNPGAAYLFIEDGGGYKGVRLFLTKIREEKDSELADELKRRYLSPEEDRAKGPKYVVYFRVDKQLPLIGSGE
ncbi:MAG: pyridoxamine 5'-phosphate oxidase family protein [Nitrospirota bacterium]|nr:MAG: pyridoxamine 5'-phosphate oxidase family protein [Nitrospirota bacterium]